MATIPCPNSTPCIDPAAPVTNFSSEAPDPNTFFSLRWPPINPNNPVGGGPGSPLFPPPVWFSEGCAAECTSTVSQLAADECAAAQAETCMVQKTGNPAACNDPQSCSTVCPDGSIFTYTVPACTIAAPSKAIANFQAEALACELLQNFFSCPGCACDFTPAPGSLPTPQIGVFYMVQFTSAACLPGPLSWQVNTGSLPPGLTLDEESGILSGTPTTPGTFNFTIELQSSAT